MKRLFGMLLVTLLAFGAVSQHAAAQGLKVGYADPEVIITYMPEYQDVQKKLAAEYKASQEALQALAQDFQERVARYQKQQPLLSAERQQEREQELATLQAEIQQSAASKDEELNQRQEELMAPLLERVQGVIDRIAADKALDVVIRSPALLYVNEDRVVNINIDIARSLGITIDDEAAN